jgi:hypothetical protein
VHSAFNGTFVFPAALEKGSAHVLTILQGASCPHTTPDAHSLLTDHMGNEENWAAASDDFKTPRGILSYSFTGSPATTAVWKVAGNLGGETVRVHSPFSVVLLLTRRARSTPTTHVVR